MKLMGKRTIYGVFVTGLIAMLLFFAWRSSLIDRYFIYFPERELEADPSVLGLAYEDVFFVASDGVRLHGWFVPGNRDVTWLWFHGNAGNVGHRLENLRLLHDELGVSIFIFDYRGYGHSHGRPSEQGTYRDAEAAIRYVSSRQEISPNRLVLFGRSLGAAIAVEMATRHLVHGLVLESPFHSISSMARRKYPILPWSLLLRTRYDSLAKIGNVKTPVLVLHGDMDDTVPIEAGRKLFEAAREPKEFYTIGGARHNDTYLIGGQDYFSVLRDFLEGRVDQNTESLFNNGTS